ncbi:Aminopeptidase C [Geodia barretti]|uniref:Bleomycin hydrolase n=1 Tax=Geodia barretti TaxID=519541 RepID=A0AA35RLV1_GEOBA|nr:Aminopeptidase C [Geodia barretti]
MTTETNPGALDSSSLAEFQQSYEAQPSHQLMQNVVTQHDVNDVALNRTIVTEAVNSFSTVLDDWSVTNQARSGRCWMFAGLNLFRAETRNLLNAVLETADRPVDDRVVAWLLHQPLGDGGQWDMFVSLVRKHGVVPKTVMPETDSSGNSMRMNAGLNYQVRQGARNIRRIYADEGGIDAMREAKQESLRAIYRILCIHLGNPPAAFDWQWKDRDGEFHRDGEMTPLEFAEKYISTPMEEYVCLVHDPRKDNPPGRTYTVQYLGNVVDGARIKYLNVDIELMKDIAMRMLQDGTPVWMGCDTGKQMHRDKGLWDADLFDYASVYNAEFSMDKEERLEYHRLP